MKRCILQPERWKIWARGDFLIEFAAVATALFVTIFGLMFIGDAVYRYNTLSNAAREAVRYAVVHSPTSVNPASADQIKRVAVNYASGVPITTSNVTVSWPSDPNIKNISNKNVAYDAQVQITYSYTLKVPFLKSAPLTLTTTSRMLVSQ